jgi:hypothetical protein
MVGLKAPWETWGEGIFKAYDMGVNIAALSPTEQNWGRGDDLKEVR